MNVLPPDRLRLLLPVAAALLCLPAAALASGGPAAPEGSGLPLHMMLMAIQVGIILLASRAGRLLARRARVPGVAAEILVGVLIGPQVLGAVKLPGFPGGVFPAGSGFPVSPELYTLCWLSAIVLLFAAGLDSELGLVRRCPVGSAFVAVSGIVVTALAAGTVAAAFMGTTGMPPESVPWVWALMGLLGAITSVGAAARVLATGSKDDSPEGLVVFSASVVDNVLGLALVVLCATGALNAGTAGGGGLWAGVGVLAVWTAVVVLGNIFSVGLGAVLRKAGERPAVATVGLGLAIGFAGLFPQARMVAVFGAYAVGLALSRTDAKCLIREDLAPIRGLLSPLLFTVMGMLVDVRLFASGRLWLFVLLYAAAALLGKIAGSGGAALAYAFNLRGALRVGLATAMRGEMALIVCAIGLAERLLPPEGFAAGVFMCLLTAMVAPPALGVALASPLFGLRGALNMSRSTRSLLFSFPTSAVADWMAEEVRTVFKAEGFLAHDMSGCAGAIQFRMGTSVIVVKVQGADLDIECREDEHAMVTAAVQEAAAAMAAKLPDLQKLPDSKSLARRVQDALVRPRGDTVVSRCVDAAVLVPELHGRTADAVIDELLHWLKQGGSIRDTEAAREAVRRREEAQPSGLRHGLAIPHARTDEVDAPVCAVGLAREGMDFGSVDGIRSRVIALVLSPASVPCVHVSVIASLAQTLHGGVVDELLTCRTPPQMREVIRRERLLRVAQPPSALPAGSRRQIASSSAVELRKYLNPMLIEPSLTGTTKDAIIDELLGLLARTGNLRDVAKARAAVMEREEHMSTGMENGVAIPHARTDAVDRLVCAIGVKSEGVDFGAVDGEPSKIFVMTLSPKDAPGPHIQFMALISRTLDSAGRDRVLTARTRDALWRALAEESLPPTGGESGPVAGSQA